MLDVMILPTPDPARGGSPATRRVVARRITDARGLEWHVRDVWSDAGHALLFSCSVAGVRAELHATDALLATLSDEELLEALLVADE